MVRAPNQIGGIFDMRIVVAGLLGAIAMFVWTAVAHMATPLGAIGFQQIPGEVAVLKTMNDSIGAKPGLFFFPWVDMKDPNAMQKADALQKTEPSGLLLYRPAGQGMGADMTPMLIKEFIKQLVQALIAASIASMVVGFAMRWATVVGIGISVGIATNVSYWNWYGFPLDYTLAAITMEVVSAIVAGLVIAWWLGRGEAKA
jgi:hypothetical protein